MVLVILFAELASAYFFLVMEKYKTSTSPYKSTLIHMLVSLVMFVPLITFLNKYSKKGSENIVKQAENVTRHTLWGPILGFMVAFGLMFISFAKIWYNRNFFEDLWQWVLLSV